MKNNLIRGIRKASRLPDGAAAHRRLQEGRRSRTCRCGCRPSSSAAASPAIDTATELLAYYPVQVEKIARALRDAGRASSARRRVRAMFDDEERAILDEFLEHGRADPRRARARRARRASAPDFMPLVRALGRRLARLPQSAASTRPPTASTTRRSRRRSRKASASSSACARSRRCPTSTARVQAMTLRAAWSTRTASWKGTGEIVELPARTVCVAAGTQPERRSTRRSTPAPSSSTSGSSSSSRTRANVDGDGKLARRRRTSRRDRLLHLVRARRQARRQLLRRQPPALRRQRRQGDGLGQGRLSRTSSRSSRDELAAASATSRRPTRDAQLRHASTRRSTTQLVAARASR